MSPFPSVDLRQIAHDALENYGFRSELPVKALKEADSLQEESFAKLDPGVKDLRDLLWSSIDNEDSRDLDQIEYAEAHPNGDIRLRIGVADVDHYVKMGSMIDHYAYKNGTSVYTGIEMFPMLPERLSTNLSSLNPGCDRMAIVMDFLIDQQGQISSGEVYRAVVHNHAQLVYEVVGAWLEGKTAVPVSVSSVPGLEEQIRIQDTAARRIWQARRENGALELDSIETKPLFKDGRVLDLLSRERNWAHRIIENFMIAANGVMVGFLREKKSPVIQRIVKTPARWERIRELADELGTTLPRAPKSRPLADFLERQRKRNPQNFPDLSLSVIKLLGQGEYTVVNPGKKSAGHFGLAVLDYTHSTAPNRRYIDLIMQRLLKAVLAKKIVPYTGPELIQIAAWCSERDQSAKKVERFMHKVAAAVLLSHRIGETFEGLVTGASEKGTYVRLIKPPAEGRVVRKFEGMDVGEKVTVRLVAVSIDRGYIDFEGASTGFDEERELSDERRSAKRSKPVNRRRAKRYR